MLRNISEILLCLCLALFIVGAAEPPAHGSQKYKLVFSENFSDSKLDYRRWSKIKRVSTLPWAAHMSDNETLYEVKNGRLRLYARHNDGIEPSDTAKYLTGGISTLGHTHFQYGKIEVRARFKGATGSWPAIWTFPVEQRPKIDDHYAEIDMVEYMNRDKFIHHTVHNYHTIIDGQKDNPTYKATPNIKFEKYNTYTLEILPTELVFSVNGKQTFVYPKIDRFGKKQFPYGTLSFLMLDMQVGGTSWLPKPEPATYPAYMDIDWVKIYKLENL